MIRVHFWFKPSWMVRLAAGMALTLPACGSATLRSPDGAAGGSGGAKEDGGGRDTATLVDARSDRSADVTKPSDAREDGTSDSGAPVAVSLRSAARAMHVA